MIRMTRFGVRCIAAVFVVFAATLVRGGIARGAESTVVDQTSLVPPAVVAQVDARNDQLYGATGEVVVVEVVRGDGGQTAQKDGVALADRVAPSRYGAIVWIATGPSQSDLLFTGRAQRWVPYDEQVTLRRQLAGTIRFCCPGDNIANLVDRVASAIQAGSKVAPSVNNYVRDRLGDLNAQQASTIAEREQRLESATGKGIAVLMFPEQPGTASDALAYSIASTMNVSGRVAAVVWLDRGQTASHFAVEQTPGFETIAPSSLAAINSTFLSDMQTGLFGEAVVAAVDRTATAIEGTSTPMPTLAPEREAPTVVPTQTSTPSGGGLFQWLSSGGGSPGSAVVVIFLLVIAPLIWYAMRRSDRGEG